MFCCIAGCFGGELRAAQPTVAYALGLKPKQFVQYDIPDEMGSMTATLAMEKTNDMTSWVVRSAQGILLRRFADTNGDRVVDQWSYYKDGLEVYRDIDTDHNTKPDQCRWLGVAGSRWGVDSNEDGICDGIDDCIGVYDQCGICNGNGPGYECWDGSLVCDEVECPEQPCDDIDEDGICDEIDDCIGEYDECGTCNGNGADYECWDGSLVCDEIECPEEPCDAQVCLSLDGINLSYSSTEDITGFQFDHNNCATNASGGDAELNSFIISASSSTLLAFNLVGGVVSAGNGILLENVTKVGSIGDVIDVKRGFARNYLIAQKKALFASKENIKEVEKIKAELSKKDNEKKKEASQIAEQINGKEYSVKKLSTENNELYGSVKPTEISKLIQEENKIDIKPSMIQPVEEIKALGKFKVKISLHSEVDAEITINVSSADTIQ